jgi:hypothetical protein
VGRSLADVLSTTALGSQVLDQVRAYADDLVLVRASGAHTTVADLRAILEPQLDPGRRTVLFIDYLQKVPLHPEPATEAEKVTRTVEALKDLALDGHVPVVLLSAVDAEGMKANRIRMHHLRGSSAIAFESDVVLMLNASLSATYAPVIAEAKRADILHECQTMQYEQGGYIIQYFSNIIDAHSAKLGGFVEAKCGFPFGNYWLKNVGFLA